MQALISVFLDSSDKLRCMNAGRTRITFLLRPPLYYVCVSEWGEPESVVGRSFICHAMKTLIDDYEGRHDFIWNTYIFNFSA